MWFDNYKSQSVEIAGEVFYDAPDAEHSEEPGE